MMLLKESMRGNVGVNCNDSRLTPALQLMQVKTESVSNLYVNYTWALELDLNADYHYLVLK